jgi:hypothetical protein
MRIDGRRAAYYMHHFFVVTFLSLVVCTVAVVSFFQCVQVYSPSSPSSSSSSSSSSSNVEYDFDRGLAVLASDVSVDCGGWRYQAVKPLAVVGVVLYPIGIPLLYLALVLRHRRVVKSADAMAQDERFGLMMRICVSVFSLLLLLLVVVEVVVSLSLLLLLLLLLCNHFPLS